MSEAEKQPVEGPRPKLVALPSAGTGEARAAITPAAIQKLTGAGWSVTVPAAGGDAAGFTDDDYRSAGAEIATDVRAGLAEAHTAVCITPPIDEHIEAMKEGTILAGFIDPFQGVHKVQKLADRGVSTIAVELVPRTTIAQSMDALSSQASLAGYAAVILAADALRKALPMMSTPAGTIRPAKILIVGTGVAGLQAIATGVRLGARVTAYDVRDAAKEQVESLGARFAKIDLGASAEAAGGYAKQITEDQLEIQRKKLTDLCADSDIVITTAQVFGRSAPKIVTADMVSAMKPGTVILDAAIATGGNVELSVADKTVTHEGVTILAPSALASHVAADASEMFASNIVSLLARVLDENKNPKPDAEEEIAAATLLTHAGEIRDDRVRALLSERTEAN